MGRKLYLVYGIVTFVLLAFVVIGFSYCGYYKSKSQRLSDSLSDRNTENENLVERVKSLEKDLETTRGQLKAKITEADMLESALSDLRKRMGTGQ